AVDRDLETICLKCLEKDPRRRYAKADDLANDLRRYLDGEPISARRLSTIGRALKWCRRKPAAAGLLIVSAFALVAFSVFGWWIAQEERDLREEQEKNRQLERIRAEDQRKLLYFAQMRQAEGALERADHDQADKLLSAWLRPDLPDLRGWEWYFLKERTK